MKSTIYTAPLLYDKKHVYYQVSGCCCKPYTRIYFHNLQNYQYIQHSFVRKMMPTKLELPPQEMNFLRPWTACSANCLTICRGFLKLMRSWNTCGDRRKNWTLTLTEKIPVLTRLISARKATSRMLMMPPRVYLTIIDAALTPIRYAFFTCSRKAFAAPSPRLAAFTKN